MVEDSPLALKDFIISERLKAKKELHMSQNKFGIGLDVGTGFLVSASFNDEDKVAFRSIRDAFVKIDTERFNPKLFDKQNISYIEMENAIYIVGDDAIEFAKVKNDAAQRPLSNGIINPNERDSAPLLRELFSHVIEDFKKKEGEILVFSIPGLQIGNIDFDVTYHSMSIQSLARSFGVDARPLNEAYAVAISELGADDALTALSFSFGAGLVNACLTYKGMSIFEFSIGNSGDSIDKMAAQAIGESVSYICSHKEKKLNLNENEYDAEAESRALIFAYRSIIQRTLSEVVKAFSRNKDVRITDAVPMVISGGTSMPPGFIDMFKQELSYKKMPFEVSDIIHASNPLRAVAKGCLLYANSLEENEIE